MWCTPTSPPTRRRRWPASSPRCSASLAALASRYRGILLDIDGVVRRGPRPIAGAGATVAALHDLGLGVAYVTNNAAATPAQITDRLAEVGVAARPEQVVTSAMAAAAMLDPGTRCLVIGMDGVRAALAERGCPEVHDPGQAQAVVVGIDHDFDWAALRRATFAIRAGARFVATNTDRTFPGADGIGPGNGAIVAAVEAATGVTPEVAGKPFAPLLQAAARMVGEPVLMVGDRHETDIAGAAALGWDTALVLTGVTSAADVAALDPQPTWVLESVSGLLKPPPAAAGGPLIRSALPADYDAIVALWDQAGMLSYTHNPHEQLAMVVRHYPDLVVVAEVDGRVAGVVLGGFDGRRGWMMRVVVDEALRRRGIGDALVGAVEQRLAARGAAQIDLLVYPSNTGAQRFWERHGYRSGDPVLLFIKRLLATEADAC